MKKYKDFEDFLVAKHAEQYVGRHADIVESFDGWISSFETDDFIKYGDEFALYLVQTFIDNLKDRL
jgi:uroporphyrinogen-III decarboxylase